MYTVEQLQSAIKYMKNLIPLCGFDYNFATRKTLSQYVSIPKEDLLLSYPDSYLSPLLKFSRIGDGGKLETHIGIKPADTKYSMFCPLGNNGRVDFIARGTCYTNVISESVVQIGTITTKHDFHTVLSINYSEEGSK